VFLLVLLPAIETRAAGDDGHAARGASVEAQPEVLVPKQRASTRTFYGWQILATGEVGSLLVAGSVFLPDNPLGSFPASVAFIAGAPTYALGGPIVHWSHQDFTKGLISFGGNIAFGVVGGLIGQSVRCKKEPDSDNCGERGFFDGLAVGSLIAPVLDAAILGWEEEPIYDYAGGGSRRLSDATRKPQPAFSVAPSWNLGPRGSFTLSLVGRF
jgi:hypothetical protein